MALTDRLLGHSAATASASSSLSTEAIYALAAHVRRSPGSVRAYAQALTEALGTAPGDVVDRHARHARTMLEAVRRGRPQHGAATTLLKQLREDLQTIPQADHEDFIKALERDFKIEVHHFDEVGPAVYVWVGEEGNEALHRQLSTSVDFFDKILEKHGYVCIRRGTAGDRSFGRAFESLSQWIFTYSPTEEAEDRKGEINASRTMKMIEAVAASVVAESGMEAEAW